MPEMIDLDTVPCMRLLRCDTCGTIDEIPDWVDGPGTDPYLPTVVDKHPNHTGQLFRLPIGLWLDETIKQNIIDQIKDKQSKGLAEFDAGFYDTRNQFMDDAMACYNAHLRPKDGCPDFRSESKRLKPATSKDRKEAGLPALERGPRVYLCDMGCPIRMVVERKARGE